MLQKQFLICPYVELGVKTLRVMKPLHTSIYKADMLADVLHFYYIFIIFFKQSFPEEVDDFLLVNVDSAGSTAAKAPTLQRIVPHPRQRGPPSEAGTA